MSSWYRRPWGIAFLGYLTVTAVLGIAFLVSMRRAQSRPPADDAVRTGGFTETGRRDATVDLSVSIFSERDPALGHEQPKLVIVEFSDFQCPFCKQAFPIIRAAVSAFGNRGLRYVYRDFPIAELHADARTAAIAAQCAHAQGKFWAYHDKLFQNVRAPDALDLESGGGGGGLDRASLSRYAEQVGLDTKAFESCTTSPGVAVAVEEDYQAGVKLGVKGTPTWFFLPNGDAQNAQRIEGVIPRDALFRFLERLPAS